MFCTGGSNVKLSNELYDWSRNDRQTWLPALEQPEERGPCLACRGPLRIARAHSGPLSPSRAAPRLPLRQGVINSMMYLPCNVQIMSLSLALEALFSVLHITFHILLFTLCILHSTFCILYSALYVSWPGHSQDRVQTKVEPIVIFVCKCCRVFPRFGISSSGDVIQDYPVSNIVSSLSHRIWALTSCQSLLLYRYCYLRYPSASQEAGHFIHPRCT